MAVKNMLISGKVVISLHRGIDPSLFRGRFCAGALSNTQEPVSAGLSLCSPLRPVMLLTKALLLLLVTTTRSEDSDIQPEVLDESLRHLHQREWPVQDAPAAFPEDTNVALLALPGSQPIRSHNAYRRRRKRPRPQPPQDEIYFPSSTQVQGPKADVLPYNEQKSYYKSTETSLQGYQSYETSVSSVDNIRLPDSLPSHSLQHQPRTQRRHPNSSRQKHQQQERPHLPIEVNNPDVLVKTEDNVYQNDNAKLEEQSVNISQEEEDIIVDSSHNNSQSFLEENSYTHKRNRDQHEQPHSSISVSKVTKPQQNSYRKPYPARTEESNSDVVVSPQDIKALLKQRSGSLSLSELLQQKNLSLADLLKGNLNALSALTGVHNTASPESKAGDTNQESVPLRRLPPQTNSRRKNQGTGHHRKPLRYSEKQEQISEDHDLESNKHRRLPPVNIPLQRIQPSVDSDKSIKYELEEVEETELDTKEHINKFSPSSPRRQTKATDATLISSTERNEVTKVIITEDYNSFQDSVFNAHNDKHNEMQTENKENNSLVSTVSTTEHDIIINPSVLEPSHKTSQEGGTKPQEPTTDHKPAPIPLNVQETSVIDPLQNSPEADITDHKVSNYNRLRGKYIPRYRIPNAQKDSISKVDTAKAGRVRLPPPNLFLSPLRPRIMNRVTSPKHQSDGTTTEAIQFINTVPQTHTTPRAVTPIPKTEESQKKQQDTMPPQDQNSDSHSNVQITDLTTETFPVTDGEDSDEPLYKVIPIHSEPSNSQSQITKKSSETKFTSVKDEILEFLKTDIGSIHLTRILASRNMTLAELIEHRERGSSQQHLADIFRESGQSVSHSTETNMSESNHEVTNNEVKNNIIGSIKERNTYNIPSIQEMFHFLEDSNSEVSDHEINQQTASTSENDESNSTEGSEYAGQAEQTSLGEPQVFDILSFSPSNPPLYIPHVPTLRPSNPSPHSNPSWKISYQHPVTIYSKPTNPYFIPDIKSIIASRFTNPTPLTPLTSSDITHSIVLLENTGQVREVASTKIKGINGPVKVNKDERKQSVVLHREDLVDDLESDSTLPTDVKSTITVSSAILGLAILGFLAIFVVCRWRQKRARRRFVDGIVNARAQSPILMQPEGKDVHQSHGPVMVNTQDLYKTDVSLDGEDDNHDPRARRYYLWRTIRKTLRYK
ncbi:uncharacterized protein LOC110829502 isoform X2 [Zootermopsis nevadensis]|uniref:uncharacterized protein LOC110829502 isoform X2 n=1 Tax=Zootermopsis nevadensis TaxID=136037 RepID=UPI000B8E6AFF|nr:uncharacterized protein LOC110829502 isoform X2 [Zootermopsis nevadensis]